MSSEHFLFTILSRRNDSRDELSLKSDDKMPSSDTLQEILVHNLYSVTVLSLRIQRISFGAEVWPSSLVSSSFSGLLLVLDLTCDKLNEAHWQR